MATTIMCTSRLAIIFVLFAFLPLVCLSPLSSSSSTNTIITLPLSFSPQDYAHKPKSSLSYVASLSLSRAHHIKYPHKPSPIPLSPHSYGAYSISLDFGTPPQPLPFILDTGSSFVWFPCTRRYACHNCSDVAGRGKGASGVMTLSSFIPKASSTAKILGCTNPKCAWVHSRKPVCTDCRQLKRCTQICPPYVILYGSGSTGGITLVETLSLPGKKVVPGFVVGCSLFSSHQPAGIVGFGRGNSSFPSQLNLKRFSYCLASHKLDDSGEKGFLNLDVSEKTTPSNLTYTPLVKNPFGKLSLSEYYYFGLRKITVGSRTVEIPHKYLTPDRNGDGGAILDSGTTFTFTIPEVFKPVLEAFVGEVKGYRREEGVESRTGLKPCFNISGSQTVSLPQLEFHFKGGAEMSLPLENYFSIVEDGVVCLTMVSSSFYGPGSSSGPSIILGNFQMQNYHVEFDLLKERLGFWRQACG